MKFIDDFLNKITMYRLVLYVLIVYVLYAEFLTFVGVLPFGWFELILSVSVLTVVCVFVNRWLSKVFQAPQNSESSYITALILSLIITHNSNAAGLAFLALSGALAMVSKYVLVFRRKHIFNPAAFAVVWTYFTISQGASWWVGNIWMLPIVVIGGFLIIRKAQRLTMVGTFLVLTAIFAAVYGVMHAVSIGFMLKQIFIYSSTIFFATVMMTEPQTSPSTNKLRIVYASLIALLIAPFFVFGSFYFLPELALLVANIFSFLVSPKQSLRLKLVEKRQIAKDTLEFVFEPDAKPLFRAGQYMEFTMQSKKDDQRGNRRYFTIASSPNDKLLKIGIKFYEKPSSFKQKLSNLDKLTQISAFGPYGDFTLPKGEEKLVFLAGGIGITPFASIIQNLLDENLKKDIILFFSARTREDLAYKNILDEAAKNGVNTVYALSEKSQLPQGWAGESGFIDEKMIASHVPDYKNRIFYISGPHQMVDAFKILLSKMGISKNNIKVDFFPGYA